MNTLEGLARELFNRFAAKSNSKANWDYISDERKLAWMKDVLLLADYFMENLKKEIKPIPVNAPSSTVYENGFNNGVRSERTSFLNLVDKIHEDLLEQFEERSSKE